jgi:hypothetical protein
VLEVVAADDGLAVGSHRTCLHLLMVPDSAGEVDRVSGTRTGHIHFVW